VIVDLLIRVTSFFTFKSTCLYIEPLFLCCNCCHNPRDNLDGFTAINIAILCMLLLTVAHFEALFLCCALLGENVSFLVQYILCVS